MYTYGNENPATLSRVEWRRHIYIAFIIKEAPLINIYPHFLFTGTKAETGRRGMIDLGIGRFYNIIYWKWGGMK